MKMRHPTAIIYEIQSSSIGELLDKDGINLLLINNEIIERGNRIRIMASAFLYAILSDR
jgi:hypothetical protein